MKDTKQTSILIRLSQDEKDLINKTAEKNNKSTNKFLKDLILNNLESTKESDDSKQDITNDITNDIIALLKNQLTTKDEQIHNLQTIIFNRDAKLIELSKKHWWQFWK